MRRTVGGCKKLLDTGAKFDSDEFALFHDNKEVALYAVSLEGTRLQYVSERLRDDLDVATAAVKKSSMAFEYASERLRGDKGFALFGVRRSGTNLSFVSTLLQDDKEVVLRAVEDTGSVVANASDRLRDDEEVMSALGGGYGVHLMSDRLRSDTKFAARYFNKTGCGMQLGKFHDIVRDDKEVVTRAVLSDSGAVMYASERLRDDKEIVLMAVKSYGQMLNYASERLRNDKEVVLEAIMSSYYALKHASYALRGDKEVVLLGVRGNPTMLVYATEEIQKLCEGVNPEKALENELYKEVAKQQKSNALKVMKKRAVKKPLGNMKI